MSPPLTDAKALKTSRSAYLRNVFDWWQSEREGGRGPTSAPASTRTDIEPVLSAAFEDLKIFLAEELRELKTESDPERQGWRRWLPRG